MSEKYCIYCKERLTPKNVYRFKSRIEYIDKCEQCTDKLESGVDMYE